MTLLAPAPLLADGLLPAAAHIVSAESSIADALATIDRAQPKIALVVDAAGRLTRTVTDGDIRRALLAGEGLASPLSALPPRAPVALPLGARRAEVRAAMDAGAVAALVLVDDQGRPAALADRAWAGEAILLSPPHMGARERELVQEAFDDNWIAPAGPNLTRFEAALAEVSGRQAALALTSGTAALHLALRVLGVRRGDRVYTSNLTFAASLQPVLYEGAVPVLIDAEPHGWNMSPAALAAQLAADEAAGTLPRAIIVVHLYGQSANMAAIGALAARYDVPLVEDAAESLGAIWQGRPSGSHGTLAAYSFNGNKIITTSGGGALVTDDPALIAHARRLATQGREDALHYQHAEVAYNYRLSNVLAGIGCGQLELLADRVAARRAIYARYRDGLADVPGVAFQEEAEGGEGNRWLTAITLDPDYAPVHPYQVIRGLQSAGIEARPGWKPMHMQPLCAGMAYRPHSPCEDVSARLFLQSLCLPSGSALTPLAQDRVIARLRHLIGA